MLISEDKRTLMRFKKIYIEITNSCNFNCSFCFKSKRAKKFMSSELFSATLFSIRPYTDYIYLHVLGEPLLHPRFSEFVLLANDLGFKVNVTTNGSLISSLSDKLMELPVRQFNFSVHDAEENIPKSALDDYLRSLTKFAMAKSNDAYFSFRLWNRGANGVSAFNAHCLSFLSQAFDVHLDEESLSVRNVKLAPHVFLHSGKRFSWPGEVAIGKDVKRCYALQTHIAVLVDGTVVPCCLDAAPAMPLGNIMSGDLGEMLSGELALRMLNGFKQGLATESICRDCGFDPGF